MVIGIIGAGASGMAAALAASENPAVQVVLMERQARVGKKLSATGNGRCNLTNLHAMEGGFHGDAPEFADFALSRFGVKQTLEWFRQLGLYTVAEDSAVCPPAAQYPFAHRFRSGESQESGRTVPGGRHRGNSFLR